jgi:hypothetical protein
MGDRTAQPRQHIALLPRVGDLGECSFPGRRVFGDDFRSSRLGNWPIISARIFLSSVFLS